MTNYLHARLSHAADAMITRDFGNVNKSTIRQALRAKPTLEFTTIATPVQPREGAYLTTREAVAAGYDAIELRFDNDRKVAMLTLHPTSGAVVVS